MIKKAIVLLPSGPERTDDTVSPLAPLGGLTLIQRILYSLLWAGVEEGMVLSRDEWPGLAHHIRRDPKLKAFARLLTKSGLEGLSEGRTGVWAHQGDDVIVHLPSWVVDRKNLKDLCSRDEPLKEIILLEPPSSLSPPGDGGPALALVPGSATDGLLQAFGGKAPPDQVIRRLRETEAVRKEDLPDEALIRVQKEADLPAAERRLFEGLVKPTESFLSRKFERKVSLAITRQLLYTRVTPNQISIASILLGALSTLLFLGESRTLHILGGVLILFSSIVDGCDGELARLRFQESRWGSWLDFLGDNVVHVSIFLCIGIGLFLREEGAVYLILGCLAALANLGAASAVFLRVFLKSGDGVVTFATPVRVEEMDRAEGWLRRRIEFTDKLSNRDFFYLVLLCAAIGQLGIFMWVASIGVIFYFFNLIYLYYRMAAIR
jgi:phosphatidylglycerophosphate synthase